VVPDTGCFKDGYCATIPKNIDTHVVCTIVTKEFLRFIKSHGNDLNTPIPKYNFPDLVIGSKWCLCVTRSR